MFKILTIHADFWMVIAAAILWGTIGVATQAIYSIDTTTSLFINLGRMLVATPILMLACWRTVGPQMFQIRGRDWVVMVVSGALLAASHSAYFAAIRYSGVTIATLLTICVAPIVVTTLSVLFRLERLSRGKVVALICALVGSVLVVGFSPEGLYLDPVLGSLFALIAAATYGSMIVGGRFVASGYHPLQISTVMFLAGTITLLLVNLMNGVVPVQTPQGWLLVLYLGVVPTALAYWLFQVGLRSVSASAASIIGMLDPVVAAVLAWVLYGESLTAIGFVGTALLLASIALVSSRRSA